MVDSAFISSILWVSLMIHYRDEQVGDARRAHVAQRGELVTINMIEQKNASTEYLPLGHGLERSRTRDVIGVHHHFDITRLEFFHCALENDAAVIDENEIGQDVLHFFNLMGRDDDRSAVIEIIVQQRIVELFSEQDIEPERRLIEHEQLGV